MEPVASAGTHCPANKKAQAATQQIPPRAPVPILPLACSIRVADPLQTDPDGIASHVSTTRTGWHAPSSAVRRNIEAIPKLKSGYPWNLIHSLVFDRSGMPAEEIDELTAETSVEQVATEAQKTIDQT
jgi:hypothetical protein